MGRTSSEINESVHSICFSQRNIHLRRRDAFGRDNLSEYCFKLVDKIMVNIDKPNILIITTKMVFSLFQRYINMINTKH